MQIFISAVSDEFLDYREQLRRDLTRHNVEVKIQEDFKDYGSLTLEKLDVYITACDAVVHLVGDMTGADARPLSVQALCNRYPALGDAIPPLRRVLERGEALSYTQWEAWLALYHGKPLLIAQADEDAPRGPNYAPDAASRAAQQVHLARLRGVERYPSLFTSPDNLSQKIFSSFILDLLVKERGSGFRPRFALSNVPILVPRLFVGREAALAALEVALGSDQGRVAITAVHGLRGVGKTTLAAAYAEQHRDRYRATWWLRAQTEAGLRADLVGLGLRLGWVAPDDKEEPALAAALDRLRHEGEGILLIYDNAPNRQAVRPYLPRGGAAQVLVTSNAPDWGGIAEPVPLEVWPSEVGADYLMKRTGRAGEQGAALELAEALGGLPLAHEQAAAYCERLGISLAEYQRRFAATPARLLDAQADAVDGYHAEDHPDGLTVAKTFTLAIAEASRLHPGAASLLAHAALLAPEPIPLFLFAEARTHLGEPPASALAGDGLDEAVAALRAFALVEREAVVDEREVGLVTECVRLHRLVRQVAAPPEGAAREEMRRALVAALVIVYPQDINGNLGTWPRARRLDGLALDLVAGEAASPSGAEVSSAWLLDRLATYRQVVLAAYAEARLLFERALAINERVLGSDHPATATSLNNLALLLQVQGDLNGARPLQKRALAIAERAQGPDHPNTATNLNNLALLLQVQGDLAEARPLYERALSVRERVLGLNHSATATSLNNLAFLLRLQGDLAGARPLYERALSVRERVQGPDHPATATSLNNLASLLQAQDDLDGARPLFERALTITERVLGPDHPDTATSLNNLASLLQAQGDLDGARPLYERARSVRERVQGPNHPDTATSLANLASLLQDQGDLDEAWPLYERALSIRERVQGPNHPDTATSLNNLASFLRARGDLVGAQPLFERALSVRERVL
ncbi:FxSxx-COOH system tetratricopeptide repeat protein, partial [Methylobacterium sp. SyP6R]|uniref:FxSxx-COOH system tetratricopeptide repeat protein n=1 Tax=Methylobacterium sp. SyP6R TaxID=2718876 RepID=UPI001F3ED4EE